MEDNAITQNLLYNSRTLPIYIPFDAVHERKKRRDNALLRLISHAVSGRTKRVDLVDEDNARGLGLCARKYLHELLLTRAHYLARDLGAVHADEGCECGVRNCARNERLACARGSVEQHSSRRPHAVLAVELGTKERDLEGLANEAELAGETTDGGERVARGSRERRSTGSSMNS